jgi:hypothetical protein
MKKADRIEAFVESLAVDPSGRFHACYLGYFECFNAGDYYEAHDVLEHLWLRGVGADHAFYKGLIQIAGAFVHLKKHYLHPHHYKHARRLAPSARLFALGVANLAPYAPSHHALDVAALIATCEAYANTIRQSDYTLNPWHPESAPLLNLQQEE